MNFSTFSCQIFSLDFTGAKQLQKKVFLLMRYSFYFVPYFAMDQMCFGVTEVPDCHEWWHITITIGVCFTNIHENDIPPYVCLQLTYLTSLGNEIIERLAIYVLAMIMMHSIFQEHETLFNT